LLRNCVAIDIGASSGRVILGVYNGDKLELKEIHRFYNGIVPIRGYDCWEIDRLFDEIIIGLNILKEKSIIPDTIAVDTWGVDYILIDKEGERVGLPIAYRDHRTDSAIEDFSKLIPMDLLYNESGIQFMQFNTLFQLYAHKNEKPEELNQANSLLFVPDYFNYLLSGKIVNEYSEASTSQLLNAKTKFWSSKILEKLDINSNLFNEIVMPGTIIGELTPKLKSELGFDKTVVVASGSHDTASAVVSSPFHGENCAFLSSGTWSLLGCELDSPIATEEALKANYTNEGGANNKILFLTNIMGMWLIQECMKGFVPPITYKQLDEVVKSVTPFRSVIDVTDMRFLNPKDMMKEIVAYCEESDQSVPVTPGQFGRCIFDSLALSYKKSLEGMESITGKKIEQLSIIGGGCKNSLLNQLTADLTGIKVTAGPIEATAIGNIMMQLKALEEIESEEEIATLVRNSFEITEFIPSTNFSEVDKVLELSSLI